MTNLFGRGKEPFWQQASTNLIKFVILLHQVLDDYVTLFQVYEHVIDPDKLRARIAEGRRRFGWTHDKSSSQADASPDRGGLTAWDWHVDANGTDTWTAWSDKLRGGRSSPTARVDVCVSQRKTQRRGKARAVRGGAALVRR